MFNEERKLKVDAVFNRTTCLEKPDDSLDEAFS